MANPPISIPPFLNVPAPGSPIKSDWPQQITTYVVAEKRPQGFVAFPTTDASGFCRVNLPVAFSSASYAVSLTNADQASTGLIVYATAQKDGAGFYMFATRPAGGAVANSAIAINVTAIGPR